MMESFTGKIALITGGGTGIGEAITRRLKRMGMDVIITGRREEVLRNASSLYQCDFFQGDITSAETRESVLNYVMEKYGDLDVLVNNAGVFYPGNFGDVDEKTFNETFEINVKALFFLTQAVLKIFMKKNRGYILNISSHAGKRGLPGSSVYCASKFAVMGINDSLNAELKDTNIRVAAICPGYVATPMTSKVEIHPETMIQPDDIAHAVEYLLKLSGHAWTREIIIERKA